MRRAIFSVLLLACGTGAWAQSAIERHAWQSGIALEPLSRTAAAITGPVKVTRVSVAFGKKAVPAKSVGMFWRDWGSNGEQHTAEIFKLASDPGTLLRGNTLCDKDAARYVVFWESVELFGSAVNMAVWSGDKPPFDGQSEGLCGTYSFVWKVR